MAASTSPAWSALDDVEIIYLPSRRKFRTGWSRATLTPALPERISIANMARAAPASLLLMPKLGFGGARLVVAVPQSWVDVSTMSDLDEAAMLFHQRHGRSLRVATKFSRLTRAFFSEQRHRRIFARGILRRHGGCAGCRRGRLRCRSHVDGNDACGKSSQGNSGRHRAANRGLPDRLAARRAVERSGYGSIGTPGRADRGAHSRDIRTAGPALFDSGEDRRPRQSNN